MKTVTITRVDSGFVNAPPIYIVGVLLDGTDARQLEPVEYILPEGHNVDETALGDLAIYDNEGRYCEIVDAGRPGQWVGPSIDGRRKLQRA